MLAKSAIAVSQGLSAVWRTESREIVNAHRTLEGPGGDGPQDTLAEFRHPLARRTPTELLGPDVGGLDPDIRGLPVQAPQQVLELLELGSQVLIELILTSGEVDEARLESNHRGCQISHQAGGPRVAPG